MNHLPQAIQTYIAAANEQDSERLASCFDADATVLDEGHLRRGRDEIAAWARDTGMRYNATIEAAGLEQTADGAHTLQATVRGQFPGSPISLKFHFVLDAHGIRSLEIKP